MLWEEKNSTDHKMNSIKNEENDRYVSITDIKNVLMKNGLNGDENLKEGKIYLITNNITGGRYVGQTNNLQKRWRAHVRSNRHVPLYYAFKKYGIENFKLEVLERTLDLTKLDDLEIKHISSQRSFIDWNEGGYNLTTGGYANRTVSEETRRKLHVANFKGGKKKKPRDLVREMENRRKHYNQYVFSNIKTGESYTGFRMDFVKLFGISRSSAKRITGGMESLGWKSEILRSGPTTE